jgi:hypothetical protein
VEQQESAREEERARHTAQLAHLRDLVEKKVRLHGVNSRRPLV